MRQSSKLYTTGTMKIILMKHHIDMSFCKSVGGEQAGEKYN